MKRGKKLFSSKLSIWFVHNSNAHKRVEKGSEFDESCFFDKINCLINGIFFNISHSFNISAVIISDHECGIDVEMVNPKVDYELISRRVLTKDEYFTYLRQRRASYFTKMKKKKETVFKYKGTGIIMGIFKELDTSKVQTIQLDDSHNNLYYLSYLATEIVEVEDMKIVII